MAGTAIVPVALGDRSYDIVIGRGLIAGAGNHVAPILARPHAVIVTDEVVAPLYLASMTASLSAAGIACESVVLPPGEHTKSHAQLERLLEALLARGVERRSTVIALGGGVIGDLAGFAASIILRGIDYIQAPTTLLAQVDSAVGGKTAINTSHGKNLVGTFHQPRLVLSDTGALDTLPRRQLLAGYAEVVKYGLIGDAAFHAWLETNGGALVAGDGAARVRAVEESCRMKAAIVANDEREAGQRALLNFGHTFGHALEADIGYGDDLLHGEAVAIGMCLAFDLSARLQLCPAADAARVRRHLRDIGLPTAPPERAGGTWQPRRLWDQMGRDKKVQAGRPTFVLSRGIGQAFLTADVPRKAVEAVLAAAIGLSPTPQEA